MITIRVLDEEGASLGSISYDGSSVTATTPGLQRICEQKIRQYGTPAAAWPSITGMTNGYLRVVPA